MAISGKALSNPMVCCGGDVEKQETFSFYGHENFNRIRQSLVNWRSCSWRRQQSELPISRERDATYALEALFTEKWIVAALNELHGQAALEIRPPFARDRNVLRQLRSDCGQSLIRSR